MNQIIDRGLLLSFDELRILLLAVGIREIEGVYMPEKVFDRDEIILTFHRMAERGIMEAEGEEFVIQKDVRRALRIMKDPEETYVFRPDGSGQSGMEFFCYVSGEGAVASEMYWKKKDTIKLRIFPAGTWEEWKEQIRDDYRGCGDSDVGEEI